PLLYEEPVLDQVPSLAGEHASAKLTGGVPLLRGEQVQLNVKAFHRRWLHVCAAVQRHQDGSGAALLAEAVRTGTLDPNRLTAELLAGRAQAIHARADALDLEPGLTATVLRLTLLPVLA